MSLILDALKRAERERRAGHVPTPLDAVAAPLPEPTSTSARRWLLPALIGAVVAGGAVYLWLSLHGHSSTAAAVVVAPPIAAAQVTAPAVVAAERPVTPEPAATPTESAADEGASAPAAAENAESRGPATLDDLVDDKQAGSGPGQGGRPSPKNSASNDGDTDRPADSRRPQRPVASSTGNTSPREELPPFEQPVGPPSPDLAPTPSTPAPSLPTAQATPPPAAVATPPQQDPLTAAQAGGAAPPAASMAARSYKEMSPNYRAEFPALSIDVHVYDADPQRRFVILNGKRYHEGETIAEGPRIVGIVADGIVFDYRGERVLYGLTR